MKSILSYRYYIQKCTTGLLDLRTGSALVERYPLSTMADTSSSHENEANAEKPPQVSGTTSNDLVRQHKTTEQQVNTIDFTADYSLYTTESSFDLHRHAKATMNTHFKKGNQTHLTNEKNDDWSKNQPTAKEHFITDNMTCCSTTKNNEQGDPMLDSSFPYNSVAVSAHQFQLLEMASGNYQQKPTAHIPVIAATKTKTSRSSMAGHSLDFSHTTLANEDTYDDLQNPHHTPVINVTTMSQMQHTETENQSTENGPSRCFNNTTTKKYKLPHHAFFTPHRCH